LSHERGLHSFFQSLLLCKIRDIIRTMSNRKIAKRLQDALNCICRVSAIKILSLLVRFKRLLYLCLVLPKQVEKICIQWSAAEKNDFEKIREETLNYIKLNKRAEDFIGAYSYKPKGPSLLYASCYAVLTFHLYGVLDDISTEDKKKWINYIQTYQSADGLFRDPAINIPLAEDVDWWGWRHLTLHAFMALTALDGIAQNEFELLNFFRKPYAMVGWLETRNWKLDPAGVSNEIQNYGSLLQYARDFQNQSWCQDVLDELFIWLDRHQDPGTGLWGNSFNTPHLLSYGVQTGYHLWLLYLYDKRPIQYMERIIDSCLGTQNRLGGFGVELNSSACEDIDSIDPLARFFFMTDYRRDDIRGALEKAFYWVLINKNPDGGWVFRRGEKFCYGHKLMTANPNQSTMFPVWFRTLSLAYLGKALPDSPIGNFDWEFLNCPGYQFWNLTTKEVSFID
jgi:hypothetical protein